MPKALALRIAVSLLLAGLASPCAFADEGEVLSASDGRGNMATVYNLFDGQRHSIQVTRLAANGALLWSYPHSSGYADKAYAVVMDAKANIFVVGVRRYERQKSMLLIKFGENGSLAQEYMDNRNDCTALMVAAGGVDSRVSAAGTCRMGTEFPARVLGFDNNGRQLWYDEYDGGGRNYVRDLQVDYAGNTTVTVETVFGDYRDGSYTTRAVVYDMYGRRVQVR
jgi:hypothetical protein